MNDEEHTEDKDEEVEEVVVDEATEGEPDMDQPSNTEVEHDEAKPLSASEYLNPPERKWVLPTFVGMLVAFFAYYWFTYLGTL